MKCYMAAAITAICLSFVVVSPAEAYTCSEHYAACMRYAHGPAKCGCARSICQKKVASGDAGQKWNWIEGINACFRR
jgi:hypothetical protein